MAIEAPIFIIGAGRTGSTIFHRIFSEHPDVAWLSKLSERYPHKPSLNRRLMRAIDYPVAGSLLRRRFHPSENYAFWEYYCKGFSSPFRDLLPGDVTNKTKERVRSALSEMLTNKRSRMLVKITGWPRVGFLHEIFNDAKFIHVLRDGRAVVNSVINQDWWRGWRGPQNWRWGELTPSQKEIWETYDKSFAALAGIEWTILMDATEKARKLIDRNQFFEVRYEDLCSNPVEVIREAMAFCNLSWSRGVENSVSQHSLSNANYKWQEELTNDQQRIVEDVIRDTLERCGYLPSYIKALSELPQLLDDRS